MTIALTGIEKKGMEENVEIYQYEDKDNDRDEDKGGQG